MDTFVTHVAPRSAPESVEVKSITENSAVVSWQNVDSALDDKDTIIGYQLTVTENNSNGFARPKIFQLSYQLIYTLESLTPSTTYHVRIAAANKVGLGPYSSVVVFTTSKHELTL